MPARLSEDVGTVCRPFDFDDLATRTLVFALVVIFFVENHFLEPMRLAAAIHDTFLLECVPRVFPSLQGA